MQIKKCLVGLITACFSAVMGVVLFVGAVHVFADYPETPNGENEAGWLGEVFDVIVSGDDLLSVKSDKLIIPTEIADVNLNKQVPTKEYVDNKVDAASSVEKVIELSCTWRYDYREDNVNLGTAINWSCPPPNCPSGWTDAGVVSNEPVSVVCSGNSCAYNLNTSGNHPVTVGRSIRYCFL